MFVEISIATSVCLQREANRKSTDGLAAQMGNFRPRIEEHFPARFPNPAAQVSFLTMVEKPFVEAINPGQHFIAHQDAATGLTTNFSFSLSVPSGISICE